MASGKARFLLGRAKKEELESLQDKVTKQSLWGSIGRTAGGLLAASITGGTVNPLTLGLLTGAATYAGGKVGTVGAKKIGKDKGELTEGRFFQAEKRGFEKELDAKNVTASLTAALTAGIGQKLKLAKTGETATPLSKGAGMDFKGSWVGKGIEKRAIGRELIQKGEASIGTADKTLQVGKGQFITGGDKAGMVLPDGTSIGSGRTSIPRGQMARGEITSKIEKAGARTGMGRESIPFSPSKVSPALKMDPIFNPKSLVESYLAPMEQYEMMDGEMVKHAGRGMKTPDWWEGLFKGKESGLSTVIGSK